MAATAIPETADISAQENQLNSPVKQETCQTTKHTQKEMSQSHSTIIIFSIFKHSTLVFYLMIVNYILLRQ